MPNRLPWLHWRVLRTFCVPSKNLTTHVGTREHILRGYLRTYHHQRPLGTKRGIRALSEFLEKGGVFTREGDTRPSWEDGPDPTEEGETRQNKRHRAHHPNIIYRIPYNT